jgi:hypothetical protein
MQCVYGVYLADFGLNRLTWRSMHCLLSDLSTETKRYLAFLFLMAVGSMGMALLFSLSLAVSSMGVAFFCFTCGCLLCVGSSSWPDSLVSFSVYFLMIILYACAMTRTAHPASSRAAAGACPAHVQAPALGRRLSRRPRTVSRRPLLHQRPMLCKWWHARTT